MASDTTRKGGSHGEDKGDVDGHELKVVDPLRNTDRDFREIRQRSRRGIVADMTKLSVSKRLIWKPSHPTGPRMFSWKDMGDARVLHVFLQSTYGDGEPTDASSEFVYWARDLADDGRMSDLFKSITYCVFGLGTAHTSTTTRQQNW